MFANIVQFSALLSCSLTCSISFQLFSFFCTPLITVTLGFCLLLLAFLLSYYVLAYSLSSILNCKHSYHLIFFALSLPFYLGFHFLASLLVNITGNYLQFSRFLPPHIIGIGLLAFVSIYLVQVSPLIDNFLHLYWQAFS